MQLIEYNEYLIKLPYELFNRTERENFLEEVAKKELYSMRYMGSYSDSVNMKNLDVLYYHNIQDVVKKFLVDGKLPDKHFLYVDTHPIKHEIVNRYFSKLFDFLGLNKPYKFQTKIISVFGTNDDGTGNILPHLDYPGQNACCINIPLEGDFSPPIVWYDDLGNELEKISYQDNIVVLDVNKLHSVDNLITTGRFNIKIKIFLTYDDLKERFLTKAKSENFKLVYKEPSVKGKNNGT